MSVEVIKCNFCGLSKNNWHKNGECYSCGHDLNTNYIPDENLKPIIKRVKNTVTAFNDFEANPEFIEWQKKITVVTKEDTDLLFNALMSSFAPHVDLFLSAGYTAVDTFFKLFPMSLAQKIALISFRKVYQKNPDTAKKLLHQISPPIHLIPKEKNPVPQSIVNLQQAIIHSLNDEVKVLESKDV